jgi:hypothetical protein
MRDEIWRETDGALTGLASSSQWDVFGSGSVDGEQHKEIGDFSVVVSVAAVCDLRMGAPVTVDGKRNDR